ncbi:MAG: helix-turn-helix transcriptional regulator [Mogibacterium sp.]|nr:helix-turn-helix transcriptional regulator [Mogibacterium sp.]
MSKEEQRRIIAERIKEYLRENKISQKHFATKMAYISESDLSKILHEKRGIQPDELKRIANAMNCDVDHLVGKRNEKTKENTDIMALLPLDEDAVEILQVLKKDCEKEAQYVSDFISFFIKALYSDDGRMLVSALAELSYLYMQNSLFEKKELKELLSNEQRFLRKNIAASKEEMREAATRIFVEFCQNRPFGSSAQNTESSMSVQ